MKYRYHDPFNRPTHVELEVRVNAPLSGDR